VNSNRDGRPTKRGGKQFSRNRVRSFGFPTCHDTSDPTLLPELCRKGQRRSMRE
jgi:hypothetical protein